MHYIAAFFALKRRLGAQKILPDRMPLISSFLALPAPRYPKRASTAPGIACYVIASYPWSAVGPWRPVGRCLQGQLSISVQPQPHEDSGYSGLSDAGED